jgi:serine/threonine protein kinase
MLLDSTDCVKLADFAGSLVDGSVASVDYEVRSRLPGAVEPTEKTDLFALGSAMYEMATGKLPYEDKSSKEVQNLYKADRFPKLPQIPDLGRVIENCWRQSYESARDVVNDLYVINARQAQPSKLQEKPTALSAREASPAYVHVPTRRHTSPRYDPKLPGSAGTVQPRTVRSYVKTKHVQNPFLEWFNWSRPSGLSHYRPDGTFLRSRQRT